MIDGPFDCPCDPMVTIDQALDVSLTTRDPYQFLGYLIGVSRHRAKLIAHFWCYGMGHDRLASLWAIPSSPVAGPGDPLGVMDKPLR